MDEQTRGYWPLLPTTASSDGPGTGLAPVARRQRLLPTPSRRASRATKVWLDRPQATSCNGVPKAPLPAAQGENRIPAEQVP
ncbi:MAG: hypothetical protein AW07_01068 [Candidatus Accumulibacter sp. SK-11]|nr:MAG: hypothetical protein AW07_01068 [Candidatus Accumulibacter sp. SK-11]